MATPTQIVEEFLGAWDQPGGDRIAIEGWFTPQTVWENVGLVTTTGKDEALALNAQFAEKFGMAALKVDNLAIAETGNKVLTERIDHFIGKDGNVIASFPVMGIFEIDDGKITAWRDYADMAGAQEMLG